MSTSAVAPIPASNTIDINGVSSSIASGLQAIFTAFNANYQALQNFDINMLSLSANLSEQQNTLSQDLISEMNSGPLATLSKNSGSSSSSSETTVASASADFQQMNSQYGQVSAQYQGLTNTVNQAASDTTQTMQTNLSMMGTNGILALLQAVSRML